MTKLDATGLGKGQCRVDAIAVDLDSDDAQFSVPNPQSTVRFECRYGISAVTNIDNQRVRCRRKPQDVAEHIGSPQTFRSRLSPRWPAHDTPTAGHACEDTAMDDASIWLREMITPWDIYLHGASEVLHWARTPFQEVCIVSTEAFGKKLFLDGIVQSSQADEFIYHEALVQPAMLAVGNAQRVLILGGGEGAVLRETLRWNTVTTATMVDLDGDVVTACRTHLPEWSQGAFEDSRTTLLHTDAVRFLRDTTEPYDVIISDMTDPVEDGPSTFCFTTEYFAAINNALSDNGVVAVQAGPQSPPEIALHAKVIRTMQTVFPFVVAYPCNAAVYGRPLGFVVASRSPIVERLAVERTASLIATNMVDAGAHLRYLDASLVSGLLHTPVFVRTAIASATSIYTDAEPPRTAHAAGWEA